MPKLTSGRVRQLREQRGWTQEALADRSGCQVRTVQRVEKDHNAGHRTLSELAGALRVDIGKLVLPRIAPKTVPGVKTNEEKVAAPANVLMLVARRTSDGKQLLEAVLTASSLVPDVWGPVQAADAELVGPLLDERRDWMDVGSDASETDRLVYGCELTNRIAGRTRLVGAGGAETSYPDPDERIGTDGLDDDCGHHHAVCQSETNAV